MTWYSKTFFWLPAEGPYQQSVKLYVNDGWKINLDMDDCTATPESWNCNCEESRGKSCGYDDTALRTLSLNELEQLYLAMGTAISYVRAEEERMKNIGKTV